MYRFLLWQAPIGQRFTDVCGAYLRRVFQIGNGAGNFDGAHISACRQRHAPGGGVEERGCFRIEPCRALDVRIGHVAVELNGATKPLMLSLAGLGDAASGSFVAPRTGLALQKSAVLHLVHVAIQIDPV